MQVHAWSSRKSGDLARKPSEGQSPFFTGPLLRARGEILTSLTSSSTISDLNDLADVARITAARVLPAADGGFGGGRMSASWRRVVGGGAGAVASSGSVEGASIAAVGGGVGAVASCGSVEGASIAAVGGGVGAVASCGSVKVQKGATTAAACSKTASSTLIVRTLP